MVETEVYKVEASRYGRRVAMRLASRLWLPLGLPFIAAMIAGTYDWRWWIVGLALLLVLYPGILLIAYYYHALSPEAVRAILPQKVQISATDIYVTYYPMAEECKAPAPRRIKRGDIQHISMDGDFITLELREREVIDMPRAAFAKGSLEKAFPELYQQK